MYERGPIIIQIIPNVTQWIMLFITCSYTFKPLDDTADKVIFIKTDPGQSEAGLFTLLTLFLSASEEEEVWTESIFTVVDQQGEFVESQRAVGRHAEEGEELTGACEGQPETQGGTGSEVEGPVSGGTRLKPVSIYSHLQNNRLPWILVSYPEDSYDTTSTSRKQCDATSQLQ